MNASITDIAYGHNCQVRNEQGEYQMQVLQMFFTIKMPCLGRHTTAYTVPVAVLTFKVSDFSSFESQYVTSI